MWFLYSHYDQTHQFFDNREEAIAEYKLWKESFKKIYEKQKLKLEIMMMVNYVSK